MDFCFSKLYGLGSVECRRIHQKLSSPFNLYIVTVPSKSTIACSNNLSTSEWDDGPYLNLVVSNYSRDCLDLRKVLL